MKINLKTPFFVALLSLNAFSHPIFPVGRPMFQNFEANSIGTCILKCKMDKLELSEPCKDKEARCVLERPEKDSVKRFFAGDGCPPPASQNEFEGKCEKRLPQ